MKLITVGCPERDQQRLWRLLRMIQPEFDEPLELVAQGPADVVVVDTSTPDGAAAAAGHAGPQPLVEMRSRRDERPVAPGALVMRVPASGAEMSRLLWQCRHRIVRSGGATDAASQALPDGPQDDDAPAAEPAQTKARYYRGVRVDEDPDPAESAQPADAPPDSGRSAPRRKRMYRGVEIDD